jgi:tetratricopeptide (TPR) repeat protein
MTMSQTLVFSSSIKPKEIEGMNGIIRILNTFVKYMTSGQKVLLLLVFLAAGMDAAAQEISYPSVRVDISPGVAFPLGADIDYFGPGIGGTADAAFTMPFLPALSLGPETGYSINLLSGDHGDRLSTIRGGAFLRFSPFLAPWLMISLQGGGGFYYSFLNQETNQSGYNPYAGGSLGLTAVLGKRKAFGIGVEGTFRSYLGFFNEAGVTVSASLHLGKRITPKRKEQTITVPEVRPELKPLQLSDVTTDPLFPTLSKYYDDHPFGSVRVYNPNEFPLNDVQVLFYINTYMDSPKECARIKELAPGEERSIDLYGLFNTSILDVYEKTKVTAVVQAKYTGTDRSGETEQPATVDILDRNALMWDDDRRAAAFVTAKDPVIMKFAKNVMSLIDAKSGINENLYKGMAVFTALDELGMTYNIDPASSYAELSETEQLIDYLQYPRQTLDYKSGDCDDLSVLTAALLESIGIETAFITIPGHIYLGFSLGVPYSEAMKIFINPEELIEYNGEAWLPLEITQIKEGFLTAWITGARQWKQASEYDEAGFFPLREAWKTYEAVAFFEDTGIRFPDEETLSDAFTAETERFVTVQLAPQVAALGARLSTDSRPYRIFNKLGILYAQFSQYSDAEGEFLKAIELADGYKPALLNLGNLYILRKEYERALEYFSRAEKENREDPSVLITMALAYREQGNFTESLAYYNKVKKSHPGMAEKYAFLAPGETGTARASDQIVGKEDLIWQE